MTKVMLIISYDYSKMIFAFFVKKSHTEITF